MYLFIKNTISLYAQILKQHITFFVNILESKFWSTINIKCNNASCKTSKDNNNIFKIFVLIFEDAICFFFLNVRFFWKHICQLFLVKRCCRKKLNFLCVAFLKGFDIPVILYYWYCFVKNLMLILVMICIFFCITHVLYTTFNHRIVVYRL